MSAFSFPTPDRLTYERAEPFPHAVFTGAWDVELLRLCKAEISSFTNWEGEKDFYGALKKRFCADIDRLPPSVQRVVAEASGPRFLGWLKQLTGERSLVADPYLEGGGIHQMAPGGFLKIHADFNWNEQLQLFRRLNVLLYLNDEWDERWGGALELWCTDMSRCCKSVLPVNNTMVVFTTDDVSFHGVPRELGSPEGINRDSIALYYYSPVRPSRNFTHRRLATDYRPIEGDSFRASRGASWLKRVAARLNR